MHEDEVSKERVHSLAAFQLHLLLHALSFPSVHEVIYSTCSVNREENEDVVVKALERFGDQFKLRKLKSKLPGWKHFASDESGLSSRVLRTDPVVDRCQGFFVAKFVRRKEDEGEVQEEEVVNSGDVHADLKSGNGMEDYIDERKKVVKRKKGACHDTKDMASGDNGGEEMEDGNLRKNKGKKKHANQEAKTDDFDTKGKKKKKKHSH